MELLSLPALAERLGIGLTGARNLVKDGRLLAVPDDDGALRVPAGQLDGQQPVKHLSAVVHLLRDAGYSDIEAWRWLTTADDSLPGSPLQALQENRATEVKRRAQALGF